MHTARPKEFPVHYTHQSENPKDELRRDVRHRQHVAGRKSVFGGTVCVRGGGERDRRRVRRRRQEEGGRRGSKGVGDLPL